MIEKITGVNLEWAHFKLRLQRPVTIQATSPILFSLFCYVPKINGKVTSIQIPTLHSECHVEWHIKSGDVIPLMDEDDILFRPENIAATIILNNTNFSNLYADFLILKNARFITIENQTSS
jgi:hypothetical protein